MHTNGSYVILTDMWRTVWQHLCPFSFSSVLPWSPAAFYNLLLSPSLSLHPLTPSLLLTTCLAHSGSARWNNTPSHTITSSAGSLKGPVRPTAATVSGASDEMWGCNSRVMCWSEMSALCAGKAKWQLKHDSYMCTVTLQSKSLITS